MRGQDLASTELADNCSFAQLKSARVSTTMFLMPSGAGLLSLERTGGRNHSAPSPFHAFQSGLTGTPARHLCCAHPGATSRRSAPPRGRILAVGLGQQEQTKVAALLSRQKHVAKDQAEPYDHSCYLASRTTHRNWSFIVSGLCDHMRRASKCGAFGLCCFEAFSRIAVGKGWRDVRDD